MVVLGGGAISYGRGAPVGAGAATLASRFKGSGFRVCGSEFRVWGSGFGVWGSGFRVQGSGFRVQGSGFRVQGLGFSPPPGPPREVGLISYEMCFNLTLSGNEVYYRA